MVPRRFPISKKLGEWDYEGGPYNFGCVNQKKNYYLASDELYQNPNDLLDPEKIREEKLKHYNLPTLESTQETDISIKKHEKDLKKFGFKGIKRQIADQFYWKIWKKIATGGRLSISQLSSRSGLQTYFSPHHAGKIYRNDICKRVSRSFYTDGMTVDWDFPDKSYTGALKPLVLPIFKDDYDRDEFLKHIKNKDWFYAHGVNDENQNV